MKTIENAAVDYTESGQGPTLLLVPGSLSTSAAWKPVAALLETRFRIVTTSLLGNGGTAERRQPGKASIMLQVKALEEVVRRAGGPVHVVSHSYGGAGALALAMHAPASVASLVLIEANIADVLRQAGEMALYRRFRAMSETYKAAYMAGEREAVSRVVDFYGGTGAYAALPQQARDYLIAHTASNMLDWESLYGFDVPLADYARIAAPTLIVRGMRNGSEMRRIAEILHDNIADASLASFEDAGHFMLSTHAEPLAQLIAAHVVNCRLMPEALAIGAR